MTPENQSPEPDEAERNDQSRPETGIDRDPSTNTTPRSNPPVDQEAVDKGKEKLGAIVNW